MSTEGIRIPCLFPSPSKRMRSIGAPREYRLSIETQNGWQPARALSLDPGLPNAILGGAESQRRSMC